MQKAVILREVHARRSQVLASLITKHKSIVTTSYSSKNITIPADAVLQMLSSFENVLLLCEEGLDNVAMAIVQNGNDVTSIAAMLSKEREKLIKEEHQQRESKVPLHRKSCARMQPITIGKPTVFVRGDSSVDISQILQSEKYDIKQWTKEESLDGFVLTVIRNDSGLEWEALKDEWAFLKDQTGNQSIVLILTGSCAKVADVNKGEALLMAKVLVGHYQTVKKKKVISSECLAKLQKDLENAVQK